MPTGRAMPSASRSRPASSIAAVRSAPAVRTRIARRSLHRPASQSGSMPRGGRLVVGERAEEAQQVGGVLEVAGLAGRA